MKMNILCACMLFSFSLEAAPKSSLFDAVYELTSSDGRKLRAKILDFEVDKVSVELETNKAEYEIPYSRLNQLTQTQLHQLWAMEVNKKLGIDIMPQDSSTLWDADILEFAKKFSIERKINIPNSTDYYYLTNYEQAILGSRAYLLRVYPNDVGDKSKLKHLEIEFANVKAYPLGETKSTIFGMAQSSDELDAAMAKDKKAITTKLKQCFGKGTQGVNGDYAFTRWDSKGHSFLLESRNRDALILHIVPTASLPILKKNVSK